MQTSIRLFHVDSHAIARAGVCALLAGEAQINLVGDASRSDEAERFIQMVRPHVVLTELMLADIDGIEWIYRIRQLNPTGQIVVLTSINDDYTICRAIQAGATGYLLKDILKADLRRAIHAAAHGEPVLDPQAQRVLMRQTNGTTDPFQELTARERDVLRLLAAGKRNRDIASSLYLTEGTVKVYVSGILDKLQVQDRTQAALFAVKHGLSTQANFG